MTGRKNRALQIPPVVPYKALEKFPNALYGTIEGTCSAQFFRPVINCWVNFDSVKCSNPVEALIFSGFFFPIAQIGKLTVMTTLHFHLHPQFKYELFHIYFTSVLNVL